MKSFKKLAFVLASSLLLCGCDVVEAKPSFYYQNEPILSGVKDGISANQMKAIYDELVTPGTGNSEKVLNAVLLKIAEAKYGAFYGEGGLFEIIGYTSSFGLLTQDQITKLNTFRASHAEYKDNAAIFDYYFMVRKSIQKSLFNNVSNTNYQVRGDWHEEKFYHAQISQLYNLGGKTEFIVAPIHGEDDYQNITAFFGLDYLTVYQDLINRTMIPDAYRKTLTEQYLFAKNYSVLGTSNARKIQYVALADNTSDSLATEKLIKAYAKLVIEGKSFESPDIMGDAYKSLDEGTVVYFQSGDAPKAVIVDPDNVSQKILIDAAGFADLSVIDCIYKGYFDQSVLDKNMKAWVEAIYEAAGYTKINVPGDKRESFEQTAYGKLLKDYTQISTNRWTTGTTTDFTNGGAYSKQTGLEIKEKEIYAKTNVTEGWFRESDIASLPSAIKTRLFYIGVANEVDKINLKDVDTKQVVDMDCAVKGKNGWYRHGSYYLVSSSFDSGSNETPYCIYDESSSTWYIVRVDEAVRAPKLTKDGPNSYSKMVRAEGALTESQIAWEVANLVADTDSYQKAAKQYYVENAAISFHDQKVYDYFAETFPDLFD